MSWSLPVSLLPRMGLSHRIHAQRSLLLLLQAHYHGQYEECVMEGHIYYSEVNFNDQFEQHVVVQT